MSVSFVPGTKVNELCLRISGESAHGPDSKMLCESAREEIFTKQVLLFKLVNDFFVVVIIYNLDLFNLH